MVDFLRKARLDIEPHEEINSCLIVDGLKLGIEIVKSDRCTPEVEVMFEVDPAFLIGWPDCPQDLN